MFCGKCGTQHDDAAVVCPNCGEANPSAKPAGKSAGGFKIPGNLDPKLIGIAAVVVVALIALIVIFTGGRSIEKTVDKYVDALLEVDAEAFIDLLPADLVDGVIEEEYDDDRKDFVKDCEDTLEYTMDIIEDRVGDIENVEYKIRRTNELDEDDLEDLLDRIDDEYDVDLNAKAAAEVKIEIEFTGDDDDYDLEQTLTMVKIGSTWYLVS